VVAEHRDKAHAHIHIIVNCVHRRHRELSDVRVQAPGNPEFAGCARELGGSYEELKKEWVFPPEKRDEVDNLCKEVYGDISNAKIRCGKPIQAWWNRDHWKIIESTPCEMERVHGWREETRYRRSTKCPPPEAGSPMGVTEADSTRGSPRSGKRVPEKRRWTGCFPTCRRETSPTICRRLPDS